MGSEDQSLKRMPGNEKDYRHKKRPQRQSGFLLGLREKGGSKEQFFTDRRRHQRHNG
jgi:hypothetical protein